jgi:hypothetical protein
LSGREKVEKAYYFFKQKQGQTVSIDEITRATGWKKGTVNTYATKKWRYYLIPKDKGFYSVDGFLTMDIEDFLNLHTNRANTTAVPAPDTAVRPSPVKYHYDVCLSFATEDRTYVETVARILEAYQIRVFVDDFAATVLGTRNLYDYWQEIYLRRAPYAVIFLSRHYANKLWTSQERKAGQTRIVEEMASSTLLARFDETDIDARDLSGNLNVNNLTPHELANIIAAKTGQYDKIQELFSFVHEYRSDYTFEQIGENILFTSQSDTIIEKDPIFDGKWRVEFSVATLLNLYEADHLGDFLDTDEFFPHN